MFTDRHEAGQRLARALAKYRAQRTARRSSRAIAP
jgi:predicted phosphoribosyltransferase